VLIRLLSPGDACARPGGGGTERAAVSSAIQRSTSATRHGAGRASKSWWVSTSTTFYPATATIECSLKAGMATSPRLLRSAQRIARTDWLSATNPTANRSIFAAAYSQTAPGASSRSGTEARASASPADWRRRQKRDWRSWFASPGGAYRLATTRRSAGSSPAIRHASRVLPLPFDKRRSHRSRGSCCSDVR